MRPEDLLMNLTLKVLSYKASNLPHGWIIRRGVKMWIDPPALCPYCKQWVQTNRLWLVDEDGISMAGVWDLRTGEPILDSSICHPHARGAYGSICRGGNKTASDALFIGISKGYHYASTDRVFYQGFGHLCPSPDVPKTTCGICGATHPHSASYQFGEDPSYLCSASCYQVAELFHCYHCFAVREFYEPKEWGGYCEECFERIARPCVLCNGKRLSHDMRVVRNANPISHRSSAEVCSRCIADNADICRSCCNYWLNADLRNKYCRECRPYSFIERAPVVDSPGLAFVATSTEEEEESEDPFEEEEDEDQEEEENEEEEDESPTYWCAHCGDNEVDEDGDWCQDCCCEDCVRERAREEATPVPTSNDDPWDYDGAENHHDDDDEEEDEEE